MEWVEIDRPDDEEKLALFHSAAAEVYRSDSIWVPQSEEVFRQRFRSAQLLNLPWMRPVVLLEGGRAIARAVAIHQPGAVNKQGFSVGYIGFFECLPGEFSAGQAVLGRCEQILHKRGLTMIQAPRSDNMLMGLQVNGFGHPQTVLTPYNPPYYAEIYLQQGYSVREKMFCYLFGRDSVPTFDFRLPNYRTRSFRRDQVDDEAVILNRLQAEIFTAHPGYVPRSLTEDRAMIESFLPMLDDELVIIAEHERKGPVGILICLPDMYQAFQGRPIDTARLISIGVIPELATRGIGIMMGLHLARNLLEKGYNNLEASWVREDNLLPQLMARRFKARPGREFVLLEKHI